MSKYDLTKIAKFVRDEVDNDKVLYQDFVSLRDNGFEFEEMTLDLQYSKKRNIIDLDLKIEYSKPFINKGFLKRKEIEDIIFSYKNFSIEITELLLNDEDNTDKKFNNIMEDLQDQMRNKADEDDQEEKYLLSQKMNEAKAKFDEKKAEKKKIINEIETTINENLKLLKDDTKKLNDRVKQLVEELNQANNSNSIKGILKDFKNDRVKLSTIRNFTNNYKLILFTKKNDIKKISYEIKDKFSSLSTTFLTQWGLVLSEVNELKTKREFLKEEYKKLKSFQKSIEAEIIEIVEDEFDMYVIEQIKLDINSNDIKINKLDLYKLCLPRYEQLKKGVIENV